MSKCMPTDPWESTAPVAKTLTSEVNTNDYSVFGYLSILYLKLYSYIQDHKEEIDSLVLKC